MPPKKAPAKKTHELAAEVRVGHKIADISKKTFIVGKQFATGGFGRIHLCTEEGKSHQMVMKIEPSTNGPLLTEVVVFNRILKQEHLEAYKKKKKINWIGLPYIIANGYFQYGPDKMRYMIIPKYATSLEAVREANDGTLAVKDALTVALCVLGALEYLHEVDYTHADIKAANILLEKVGDYSTSVLVDFGLAHRTTNNVDKPDKKRAHNGTCIFTSTDAHKGNNPSFRGDVEILAYNLVMWLTGFLPWMGLELFPDRVFGAKQTFVAELPGTLQHVLKAPIPSSVVQCIASMFNVAMKTNYTSKVDMEKLKQMVNDTIQKAAKESQAPAKKKKECDDEIVLKKSGRKVVKKVESDDEEDEEEEEQVTKKATSSRGRKTRKVISEEDEEEEVKPKKETKSTKKTKPPKKEDSDSEKVEPIVKKKASTSRKVTKPRRVYDSDDDDDDDEEEEIFIPKPSKSRRNIVEEVSMETPKPETVKSPARPRMRLGVTASTASNDFTAKKIEQKYKRLQMNKSSMVPVSITVSSPEAGESPSSSYSTPTSSGKKRLSGGQETVTLKTPALIPNRVKKAKYKSGISSATKASPTELRRVPGVRNFPKGRRSMIIKETSTRYQEKRAARPTFDDSSCSSEV